MPPRHTFNTLALENSSESGKEDISGGLCLLGICDGAHMPYQFRMKEMQPRTY